MFLVVEGVDGSGKATQTALLKEYFLSQGKTVATISYPKYGHPSSYFVEKFLNGTYGSLEEVDPYLASMFYTLDRFDDKKNVEELLATHDVVISDRYSVSSFVHRGAAFLANSQPEKIPPFFDRLYEMEFTKAGLPLPDSVFFLSLSIKSVMHLLQKKSVSSRAYITHGKLDLPERNVLHQQYSLEVGTQLLPAYFPNYFVVSCEDEQGVLLSPEAILPRLVACLK